MEPKIHHTVLPATRPPEYEWLRIYNGDGRYREEMEKKKRDQIIQMANPIEHAIIIKHYL